MKKRRFSTGWIFLQRVDCDPSRVAIGAVKMTAPTIRSHKHYLAPRKSTQVAFVECVRRVVYAASLR